MLYYVSIIIKKLQTFNVKFKLNRLNAILIIKYKTKNKYK